MESSLKKSSGSVLVGLSGGVDSAVAAMLLVEAGYSVTGVIMAIYGGEKGNPGNACYGPEEEDIERAGKVAAHLDIPFQVIDCVDAYAKQVLTYFRETYLAGNTPNPCIRCNCGLKFGLLPARAKSMGLKADFFATGHYARKFFSRQYGRWLLLRGADPRRDQSYFLYRLTAAHIANAVFPLGEMSKEDVRALAGRAGLPVRDSPDSQDFYSGKYQDLLGVAPLEGAIVDTAGKEVGRHRGYWNFTPGQRRGLGVSLGEPVYVLSVDPVRNQVVVGARSEASRASCLLTDTHFHIPPREVQGPLTARLRSSQEPVPVTVREEGKTLRLFFDEAQRGVAPGQSAVLYDGDIVVGGGVITDMGRQKNYRKSNLECE
jgi:tRNA-specific 2-thiouridylase